MPKSTKKAVKKPNTTESESASDNRDFRRRSVLWPAKIIVGTHEFSCQIWNLSLGGARVRMDLPIQEGTNVTLSIADRGELSAKVAWAAGGSLGLDFTVSADVIKNMFEDRLHILGLDEETK